MSELSPTHLMVDPPSGWKYGFPKRMPIETENVEQWLIDHGYPEELCGDNMPYLRMWAARGGNEGS